VTIVTQEVALKAVLQHGRALEFASERLRGDFDSWCNLLPGVAGVARDHFWISLSFPQFIRGFLNS
jgi:hypothetical protein